VEKYERIRLSQPQPDLQRLRGITRIPIRAIRTTADRLGKVSSAQLLLTRLLHREAPMQAEVPLLPVVETPAAQDRDRHAAGINQFTLTL
jgi:hypothetical protein